MIIQLRLQLLLAIIASFLLASCSFSEGGSKEKAPNEKVLLVEDVNKEPLIDVTKDTVVKFTDVYSAETGHWFSYPKSYKVINNTYGDTMHLTSEDDLVTIKKWFDLESMPINYFDKDGDGDVDSLLDINEIVRMYKVSIDKYTTQLDVENVDTIKSEDFESIISVDNGKSTKTVKILLCDVVGGSKIPVFLEVTQNNAYTNKQEVDFILESFRGKFIGRKK